MSLDVDLLGLLRESKTETVDPATCPSRLAGHPSSFIRETAPERATKELLLSCKCTQNVNICSPNLSRTGFGFPK
jgi:hypothetical protein